MKKFVIAAAVATLLPLSAQAKTLCFTAFGGLDQVKLTFSGSLKKPGSVVPLKGIWVENSYVWPLEGSAATNSDGSITIGFTLHSMLGFGNEIHLGAVVADQTLVGSYNFDSSGDRTVDGSTGLDTLNCKDFTLPVLP